VGLKVGNCLTNGGFVFDAEVNSDLPMRFTAGYGCYHTRPGIIGEFSARAPIPGYDGPKST
jgi:hypothetical protein